METKIVETITEQLETSKSIKPQSYCCSEFKNFFALITGHNSYEYGIYANLSETHRLRIEISNEHFECRWHSAEYKTHNFFIKYCPFCGAEIICKVVYKRRKW